MATTIALTTVLIWYAVTPEGLEARVRTYAGGKAIEERSVVLKEKALTENAKKAKRSVWDETDVCALAGPEVIWGGSEEGMRLRGDIAPAEGAGEQGG